MRRDPEDASGGSFTFDNLARQASVALGSAWAFILACAAVVTWGATGAVFNFSDAWQLVINTGTTIATFLMVFLLQNTQNRDAKALHLKLDELIRSTKKARNRLIDLEDCTEQELDEVQQEFERLRKRSRHKADDPAVHGAGSDHQPQKPTG
ncbi:MAG TPA: low affinity iron permease family protein [Hyphomicrobiaceae bacterium]|nr:low affinity iron permease family protein [Hyphomicrobiaceae bacterium]